MIDRACWTRFANGAKTGANGAKTGATTERIAAKDDACFADVGPAY